MRLFLLFMICAISLEAVVSITPVNIGDKAGLSGTLSGSFETKRGNTDKDDYTAGARIQYDNNKSYLIWADMSFSYGEASGETNTNKTFAHVRYIHRLYKKALDWESFTQTQGNEFTLVKNRTLLGLGLRYNGNLEQYGKVYIGLGAFYERIVYTTNIDPDENNRRANIYLAYKKDFSKDIKLSYLGYYQPKLDYTGDYILSSALALKVRVYQKLYINFRYNYTIDTNPAISVKKVDVSQKTSFVYEF
ncbi:DUF481 domain-containing protein [Sulfurimonas sp.]